MQHSKIERSTFIPQAAQKESKPRFEATQEFLDVTLLASTKQ